MKQKGANCCFVMDASQICRSQQDLASWCAPKEGGPVTVAERSKACTDFARSEAGIGGSNLTQGMDVWCVCLFCVCVVLCLGRGLATS
jgi:hypothetical protein